MTMRNLASKVRACAVVAVNKAARQKRVVAEASRSRILSCATAGSNGCGRVRTVSSMPTFNRSPSLNDLHLTDHSERKERIRAQVMMCPKKARREYGTNVDSTMMLTSTPSSFSSLEEPRSTGTWNSPVRHAPSDSLQEDNYDRRTVMAGYVPNADEGSASSPGNDVAPFDRSSAEVVMSMMETSYYYASYRARNHVSSEERGTR
jgi:hypothetical protein